MRTGRLRTWGDSSKVGEIDSHDGEALAALCEVTSLWLPLNQRRSMAGEIWSKGCLSVVKSSPPSRCCSCSGEKAAGWGGGPTSLTISGVDEGQEPGPGGRDGFTAAQDNTGTQTEEGSGEMSLSGHLSDIQKF